ncbi:MAG: urease accessory protein UreD [Granulosicoccus sp.]|nr:urease accessory protein UreD [Granulosicoccus sp.]
MYGRSSSADALSTPHTRRQRIRAAAHVAAKRDGLAAPVSVFHAAQSVAGATSHSTLASLDQQGSARIRLPNWSGSALQAVLINTAGGLTGDDRIQWSGTAHAGSRLCISTAACEKLYRTHGPPARQDTRLRIESGARLDWLPQETIVFDGASLQRNLHAELDADATALFVESIVLGRQAMRESITRLSLHDRWRIVRDGSLLHAEELRLDFRQSHDARRQSRLHHYSALSTVVLVSPQPSEYLRLQASRLQNLISDSADDGKLCAAASVMDHRLIVRVLASNSRMLRNFLIPCIELLNDDVAIPQVWKV